MAVSMKTSMRSDFMISDAAMPQRMTDLEQSKSMQMAQFAKILGELDGSKTGSADVMNDVRTVMKTLQDDEKFEQALNALDSELRSRISAVENGGKADDGVFRNKTTGDILPTDTYELAKMVVDGKLDIKDIPDELMSEELINMIIAMMIEKRLNPDADDEDKEEKPEDELFNPAAAAVNEQGAAREIGNQMLLELYGIIEKRNEDESEEKDTMLDGISEAIDATETLASIATGEIHAEEKAQEGVFEQIIDNMTDGAEAQIEGTAVIPTEDAAQSDAGEAQTQTGADTDSSWGFGEATGRAEDFGDVIESFTAKEANTSEEIPAAAGISEHTSRVRNAGEELEMLKNAKLTKTSGSSETTVVPTESAIAPDQTLVFTGANGERIEVNTADIVEQAARLVEKAIEETQDQSEYSLVLNPETLGRITVKMVKAADGAVSVTIAAENVRTQRVLEQHSELMQSNLRSNGIDLESWQTVNESKQDMHSQDYNGSSKNPYFRNDTQNNDGEDDGERSFAEIIASM